MAITYDLYSDSIISVCNEQCTRRENVGKRRCSKRCITNQDCVSAKKKCLCDGVCGLSCINPNAGCDLLPPISYGRVDIIPPNMIGGRARYSCYPGFHLVGRSERTCQPDGKWDGAPPSCEKVVCGRPPEVEHASHDAPDQLQFQSGTHLTYTCVFGYYREGAPRAVCTGEGQWVGPKMTCKARNCGAPGEINNGWRDPGYKFTFPSRVTYHCDEGFELLGRAYRECQSNGEWSGILPTCEPIQCQELGPPLHGTMIGSGRTYGSIIKFVCNDGYKVVGSDERRCQAGGMWSGQEARCEEIDCGIPGPVYNGYIDGHRTSVGAIFFYRCYARTTYDGTSFFAQCLENGQWSQPPPRCLGQCAVPAILNGSVVNGREGVWVDHGTAINYTCKEGLQLNDTSINTCNNGTWRFIPRCLPAPCKSPPPLIENGHRVFFTMNHGDRARYFCMEGYRLYQSNKYLTCNFGAWEGVRPYCEENFCPNPGTLTNGQIYKKGHVGKFRFKEYIVTIKHGDRLEYECHRNFKLQGPKGAACVNGKWSPQQKPKCVPARHPILPKLWRPMEELS
ncbi:hypothetical protein LOTGIDRAFT_225988 [Lottia gigantea]|uniref:Sushi domain-containing protein n=1 Tax=Lottia gigantea TaxID=225164 RepID=V4A8G6_LOTGI|nr:hypothetical protein LOTGIDRAFT_225988 [Lottia gigantea]ESP00264.1 hypothetical protein LOTGIDRAFT_225988 [Lottia gigantea]